MSWLTGIAGRAEALLGRMDQAAATSIQSTGFVTPQRGGGAPGTDETASRHHTSLTYEPTASVGAERPLSVPSKSSTSIFQSHKTGAYSPVARPEAPPKTTPTPSSYNAYRESRYSNDANDDSIFQFLNTPSKQPAKESQLPAVQKIQTNPQIAQPDKTTADQCSNVQSWGSMEDKERGIEKEREEMNRTKDSTPNGGERIEERVLPKEEGEREDGREEEESVVSVPVGGEVSPAHSRTTESGLMGTAPEEEGDEGPDGGERERGGGGGEGVSVVQNQPKVDGGRKDNGTEHHEHQLVSLNISIIRPLNP